MSDGAVTEDVGLSDEQGTGPEALVGEVLADRYRIDEHIGGGGMGEVYRAEHVMMKKTVAVKVLRSQVADRENVAERFRREAQAAANIDHSNVCDATDFGRTDDGEFYLVMEYLEGETLEERLTRRGPMDGDRVAAIADEVAAALERAHDLGIVHRDLKPDNVMLVDRNGDEEVKVLDFGISRVQMADDMSSLTKTGAIFGTPDYMAPEQAAGKTVDHRADLYALGAVMYELLAGRPVFEADQSIRTMAAHLEEMPTPLDEIEETADVSPELADLVMGLLEKDPDDRPQTATDVRGRLAALRQGAAAESGSLPARDGGGADDQASDDTHTIEIQVPTKKWLKRAGEHSRAALTKVREAVPEDIEESLPFEFDLRDLDHRTIAAFSIFAGACVIFVVVTLFVMSLGGKPPEEVAGRLASERESHAEKIGAESAAEAVASDSGRRALDELQQIQKANTTSDHVAFWLGRAHADANNWSKALEAYEQALDRGSAYAAETSLLEDVLYARGSSDDDLAGRADEILAPHLSGATVAWAVAEIAWSGSSGRRRNQAHEVLREYDLMDELPEVQRLSVKLRHADGCEAHATYIDQLVALGDPEGLDVLRVFDDLPKRGCGFMNSEDCYGCIRDDISEAIETLEQYE